MQAFTVVILVAGAMLAALLVAVGMASAVHLTSTRRQGYFHLIFYAMLLMVALTQLFSERNFAVISITADDAADIVRHPVLVWVQRLVSLLVLTVAGERIITRLLQRTNTVGPPPVLMVIFIVFWTGTVAAPALFGARPQMSHDYAYSLIIGIAAILATSREQALALATARNALIFFMVASLLLIPFVPSLVLDSSYTQGLLPGVPRLAGLAAHPVSLGILAQTGLLCVLAYPLERVWLNRLAWVVGLSVLFLAQSKTAWISFAICATCIVAVRHGPGFWRRFSDPVRPEFGIISIFGLMAGILVLASILMFADLGVRLDQFFDSSQGAQLASLTGRDQIWAIAWAEWGLNPVFGYGPTLWDADYRAAIRMPNATHAHSQFMDTLSRSGTVGATALALYGLVLLWLSIRYARATDGLSLALFAALALRSISEVPLLLFGYGAELITHVLLLMTLAAARQSQTLKPRFATAEPQTVFRSHGPSLMRAKARK